MLARGCAWPSRRGCRPDAHVALAPEAGRRDARMALAPEVGRRRDAHVALAPGVPAIAMHTHNSREPGYV